MGSITRLALTDFRSYTQMAVEPSSAAVVLVGENGAGKTNILEAVSLLVPGRGLRQATLSEVARRHGPGGFAVAATLDAVGGTVEIGTGTLASAPERRRVRVNGAAAALTTLSEWLSVLWLTPAMDRLFVESAGGRRRFLDRLVLALNPGHAHHAARYEAAMRARNRLLGEEGGADPGWLGALETGMAEHGAAIARARAETVAALGGRLAAAPVGPFARAGLALTGWSPQAGDAEAALRAELRRSRGGDAGAGRTTVGPHRSDLAVVHLDKHVPASQASTGEQKALLLGLILAHADLVAEARASRPIMLLDEVAAHLDARRRSALFDRLAAAGGQVWMTGTDAQLFDGVGGGACLMRVADGRVTGDLSCPTG